VIGHGAPLEPNQELRRRADNLMVDKIEIEHVWRRVDRPQCTINTKWVHVARDIDALRQNDLEDVSGGNVLTRRLNHLQVPLPRRVWELSLFGRTVREFAADRHCRLLGAQAGDQLVDFGFGSVVGFVEDTIFLQRDMGYGLDCPRQVIEHQQCVSQHPDAVW
jgi:hypothetical protein